MTERRLSFGSVAESYDRFRPAVPLSFNQWLGLSRRKVVLDLAAGTGLATRTMLASGASLVAVEPDDEMRRVLTNRSPELLALSGCAELIPLEEESVDLVVVVSAWHWFEATQTFKEAARVLRDGGTLAVAWNGADQAVPWVRELFALRRAPQFERLPGQAYDRSAIDISLTTQFANVETIDLSWSWRRTTDELTGLISTFSGVIAMEDSSRSSLLREVNRRIAFIAGEAGAIDIPMSLRAWRARRVTRASTNILTA